MSGLLANYRNECAKLMSSKKYIVFIIIEILICAVAVFSKLIVTSISKGTWTMNNISSPISLMTLFVSGYSSIYYNACFVRPVCGRISGQDYTRGVYAPHSKI